MAVFGSNIALLVPQSVIGRLHQPRVAGASVETLRQQVATLQNSANQLRRENERLATQFALQEKAGSETIRRVGALEVSLPRILEAVPSSELVDRQNLTASIGTNDIMTFDADGGSVAVRQLPLPGTASNTAVLSQPLPAPVQPQASAAAPNAVEYGIAVGSAVPVEETPALWNDLTLKLGPLLLGLSPLVAEQAYGTDRRIIVGPISELAEARALCERFERVAIACMPMPYDGAPLNLPQ